MGAQDIPASYPVNTGLLWPLSRAVCRGLGLCFGSPGFPLTGRQIPRYLLPPSHTPHRTAQLTLAPLKTNVSQSHQATWQGKELEVLLLTAWV